jgi:hypothetical protein
VNTHSGRPEKVNILSDQLTSMFTAEDTTNVATIGPSPFLDLEQIEIQPNRITITFTSTLSQTRRSDQLRPALTLMFQASLHQVQAPTILKAALITPLFKKGDCSKPSNYRPVSLTPICCKIMGHIIYITGMKHLDMHGI